MEVALKQWLVFAPSMPANDASLVDDEDLETTAKEQQEAKVAFICWCGYWYLL